MQTEPTASTPALPPAAAAGPGADAGAAWSQRLRLLLESAGEGIFGIDLDGRCTLINRAGAQMLGWRTEQVLGKNMHCLMHHTHGDGSAYPEADCPIFNAFRRGLPSRPKSVRTAKRSRGAWASAAGRRHSAGRSTGALRPITDLRSAHFAAPMLPIRPPHRQQLEAVQQGRTLQATLWVKPSSVALDALRDLLLALVDLERREVAVRLSPP